MIIQHRKKFKKIPNAFATFLSLYCSHISSVRLKDGFAPARANRWLVDSMQTHRFCPWSAVIRARGFAREAEGCAPQSA